MYDTLWALVAGRGKVVSKSELLSAVWSDSFVEEGSVAQNIFVLRKLLAQDYPGQEAIETVARTGYRFRPSVTEVNEEAAPPLGPPQTTVRYRTAWWAVAAGVGLLAIGSVAGIVMAKRTSSPAHGELRLAILDFRNLSGSKDADWLGQALPELLSTDLALGTKVDVLPGESVARAQRELGLAATDGLSRETIRKIEQDLDCDRILTASYLVTNGDVHIDLHLVDAHTGRTISSSSITRPESSLQSLVAGASTALRPRLGSPARTSEEDAALSSSLASNPQAYRLYIEGEQLFRLAEVPRATDALEKSIALDPNFPLSRALLAASYRASGLKSQSREQSDAALALMQNAPHDVRLETEAQIFSLRREGSKAEAAYAELLRIHPDDENFGMLYIRALQENDKPKEALAEAERWVRRSKGPVNPRLYMMAADVSDVIGDFKSAGEWSQKAIEESNRRGALILAGRGYTTLAETQLNRHLNEEALQSAARGLEVARSVKDETGTLRALNRLGQVNTAMGRLDEAQKYLEQSLQMETATGEIHRQIHTLGALGYVASKRGNHRDALDFFHRQVALAERYKRKTYLVDARMGLAKELSITRDFPAAEKLFNDLIAEGADAQKGDIIVEAHLELAEMRVEQRRYNDALQHTHDALASAGEKFPLLRLKTLQAQAFAQMRSGKKRDAEGSLKLSAPLLEPVHDPEAAQQNAKAWSELRRH